MSKESGQREAIVRWARSLFQRGYTVGSSGNISVRLDDGYLVTPTSSCFGFLEPDRLSRLDADGKHIAGDPPTKELPLHLAFYQQRPEACAVVHLHSTHATALACLADTDPDNALPPITPYAVMRLGRVPVIPYTKPGSSEIVPLIRARAAEHTAVILANHGPVVAGNTLQATVFATEELEETAKLIMLTQDRAVRLLTRAQVADLNASFKPG